MFLCTKKPLCQKTEFVRGQGARRENSAAYRSTWVHFLDKATHHHAAAGQILFPKRQSLFEGKAQGEKIAKRT